MGAHAASDTTFVDLPPELAARLERIVNGLAGKRSEPSPEQKAVSEYCIESICYAVRQGRSELEAAIPALLQVRVAAGGAAGLNGYSDEIKTMLEDIEKSVRCMDMLLNMQSDSDADGSSHTDWTPPAAPPPPVP